MKGYGGYLNILLSNNYNLYSVTKSGSGSDELNQTANEVISQLSHEDAIVIFSGTNDYELNEFSHTFRNISPLIQTNCHTNVILMNVPLRYDPPNSASVNSSISILNRKLKKLVKAFPNTSFIETPNGNLFTNHGIHLNKIVNDLLFIS